MENLRNHKECKWKPGFLAQSNQQDEGYGYRQQCVNPKAPGDDVEDDGEDNILRCQTKLSIEAFVPHCTMYQMIFKTIFIFTLFALKYLDLS